jgi:O-antigen/teichoic acid export membrane protein
MNNAKEIAPERTTSPLVHTVSQRFLITLAAQISKSALSFMAGMVVARGLGPVEYGNLAFLLGSFTAIRLVVDMASGQAFFTLSSQRPRSRAFYCYYLAWFGLFQITLPVLLITLLLPQSIVDVVWQSQGRERICLAFMATNMQYLFWPQVIQLGEVVRRTFITQSLTIAISLGLFLIVACFYLLKWLTLSNYLVTISIVFILGGLAAFAILPRPWHADAPQESFVAVFAEFFSFCKPLIFSMGLQAFSGWTEVWLLQRYPGPVAQGFFALGMQISLIGLLATTSLQNIFWREVAELEGTGNDARIRDVYIKTSRALLLTAAAPIAFLIPWTPQIVDVLLGPKYHGAAPVIAVMLLYPIAQTVVTLAIVMFSAMRQTRVLAIFSSAYAILYMITGYILVAPPTATVPGLGLGAFATGVKLTLFGFGQLLVWETWINRQRSWRNDWPHRLRLFTLLIGMTLLARLVGGVSMLWLPPSAAMVVACFVYITLASIALLRWPEMLGMPTTTDSALRNYLKRFPGIA